MNNCYIACIQNIGGIKKCFALITGIVIIGTIVMHQLFFADTAQVKVIDEVESHATIMLNDTKLDKNHFKSKEMDQPRVRFIPFPHKSLGSGSDVACSWSTPGGNLSLGYDLIQRTAFTEGVCIPSNVSIHVFSSAEAIECLSPTMQNRNVSLVISGDSYNRQLFIGLADILLGQPSNLQVRGGKKREVFLQERISSLAIAHQNNPSFPKVQFVCKSECYGGRSTSSQMHIPPKIPFSKTCSSCINAFTKKGKNQAAVVGAFVHVFQSQNGSVKTTGREMKSFFTLTDNIIFNSMPSLQMEKVPIKYRNRTDHSSYSKLYHGFLPDFFPNNKSRPFIDYFQLTKSCDMANCSFDGGHRSRYVNRWKAQLLLNTICEVHEQS